MNSELGAFVASAGALLLLPLSDASCAEKLEVKICVFSAQSLSSFRCASSAVGAFELELQLFGHLGTFFSPFCTQQYVYRPVLPIAKCARGQLMMIFCSVTQQS